ncbi:3-dehydroquinate synthase [Clostridium acetireducens DSM 10703]|jgi:3-dehydroquinate synthase|uniref:3-dehydroquinate synthase n=1 Tax=Clostridium acetireducens DSM 10703 TaxID=1121290 RepID=A0A1E8F1P1_9CLOT|nr:3-dehydroquinate synthase [Clostridium acetireducens]OFI07561.1 3-dehydroquinate synthase [Clostridium acetireducens DSM 10703]
MNEILVKNKNEDYRVYIDRNMFKLKKSLEEHKVKKGNRIFLITDDNVYNIHKNLIEKFQNNYNCNIISFKPGENSKNYSTIQNIYSFLLKNNADRNSILIAFGGGIVGDITGFVASTFMRGIKYINIPTTFLSQVDSCIGGKTAYNYNEVKNAIGSFYNPLFVYVSTEFLKTLNEEEFINGIGEVIKYGVIKNNKLLNFLDVNYKQILEKQDDELLYIIKESLYIKSNVIYKDFHDKGIRNILNFGHTVAHGIEVSSNYSISHGKAVALGMLVAIKISEKKANLPQEVYKKIEQLYKKFSLPYKYKVDNYSSFLYAIKHDKKNTNGITFTLLEDIESCKIKVNIGEKDLTAALKESIN